MLKTTLSALLLFLCLFSIAQFPNPAIVGYWENWNGTKFVALKDIDPRYNVIHVSFASAKAGTDYDLEFVQPSNYTVSKFKSEMAALQSDGKKVFISLGGQNDPMTLDSDSEKDAFISSVNAIVDDWGFDGIDIDFEGTSMHFTDINVSAPGDPKQQRLIAAIQAILANHQTTHGERLLLTMAPETIYVQGALSKWAGNYRGAYLPIIEALSDDIDMINVQLYNSGNMFGVDGASGGEFSQATPDFLVAMTEALIRGFVAVEGRGTYSGIEASKVGIGLPGCAGWGYTTPADIEAAVNYLRGDGPKPGNYTLKKSGGYPDLRGMMTWSINSDAKCSPSYGYVSTYEKLFTVGTGVFDQDLPKKESLLFPNPVTETLYFNEPISGNISIMDAKGNKIIENMEVSKNSKINVSDFPSGLYQARIQSPNGGFKLTTFVKK